MTFDFTLNNLLLSLLILVGIGVGIILIMVLLKANKILKNVNDVLEVNTKALDTTMKLLPEITYNVNEATKEVQKTIISLTPDINMLLADFSSISEKVNRVTGIVEDATVRTKETVHDFSNSVVTTANSIKHKSKGLLGKFLAIKNVAKIVMKVITK